MIFTNQTLPSSLSLSESVLCSSSLYKVPSAASRKQVPWEILCSLRSPVPSQRPTCKALLSGSFLGLGNFIQWPGFNGQATEDSHLFLFSPHVPLLSSRPEKEHASWVPLRGPQRYMSQTNNWHVVSLCQTY